MRTFFLAGPIALVIALLGAIWWGQEFLIFKPVRLPAEHRFSLPADVHETFVDVHGARLHALHLKVAQPRGVVFYLHGNGGNVADWFVNHDWYRRLGYDLFMPDYRGYGKSTGHVTSEAQLLSDLRAAWESIAPAYAGRKVVFFGRSLGSGLAASLAASLEPSARPDLLILVAPYRNLPALAAEHYPLMPSALIRYELGTDRAIGALGARPLAVAGKGVQRAGNVSPVRILLIHGGRDTVIPPGHSEVLARLLPDARRVLIPDAAHNDLQAFAPYRAAIEEAITSLSR